MDRCNTLVLRKIFHKIPSNLPLPKGGNFFYFRKDQREEFPAQLFTLREAPFDCSTVRQAHGSGRTVIFLNHSTFRLIAGFVEAGNQF